MERLTLHPSPSRSPDTVYKGPVIFMAEGGGGGEEYAFQGEVGWRLVIANRVRRGLWKIDYWWKVEGVRKNITEPYEGIRQNFCDAINQNSSICPTPPPADL